ncbi:SH3 domain-containing protein [Achromobacter sp.]|uniref:SH3 domain-containing protein n=1 Tax=Achromobacter sp. TaxID=134375 RepID=UPI002F92919B
MNPDRRYLVIQSHASEFPEPMRVRKGDRVAVGERYDGPEGWPDWYHCTPADQEAGFVPAQFLDHHADGSATMLEDFTNKELDVAEGEVLRGERELNGWVWATRLEDGETGWVPLDNLRMCDQTIC